MEDILAEEQELFLQFDFARMLFAEEEEEEEEARIVVSIKDITERKRTEEELIRLSNAVRMSKDSIVISDLEGKIIDVNEATLEMFGSDNKRELIGRSSFDLIAPEDREKAASAMKEVMGKGYIRTKNIKS